MIVGYHTMRVQTVQHGASLAAPQASMREAD
jgi:hypothetical protein